MPTTTRTTDKAVYPRLSAAVISQIRTKIVEGTLITASDIQNLWNCVLDIYNHTHGYYDNIWVAYGNTSPYGSSSTRGTTGKMSINFSNTLPTITMGALIKASDMHLD